MADYKPKIDDEEWFSLYCQRADPDVVAQSWISILTPELRTYAEENSVAVARSIRTAILASPHPTVREEAETGFKYTGAVMRAIDKALGVPPPQSRFPAPKAAPGSQVPASGGYASGGCPEAPKRPGRAPICIIEGGGRPGKLGIWWTDYDFACDTANLRKSCGVTHRLNCAKEVVDKLPASGPDDTGTPLVTAHVPMQDIFSDDEDLCDEWIAQFKEILKILCGWRDEGAVVNINCQMGKNRSGCVICLWLVKECGWNLKDAVDDLRAKNALACANPHLLVALGEVLGVDGRMALNPAKDGGGWVCISPPGSPRVGAAPGPSFEDLAEKASTKLAQEAGAERDDAPDMNSDMMTAD